MKQVVNAQNAPAAKKSKKKERTPEDFTKI